MTLDGRVENGMIVLDAPAKLPDGTRVRIEVVDADSLPSLMDRLGRFASQAKHLSPDASSQHDHYLYGTPKKQ